MKVHSLKRTIIAQFLVILLPLGALLAYVTIENAARTARLNALNGQHSLALMAKQRFAAFSSGVADAAGKTGLSEESLSALRDAHWALDTLAKRAQSSSLSATAHTLRTLREALEGDGGKSALLAQRPALQAARDAMDSAQASYDAQFKAEIARSIEQSDWDTLGVMIVSIVVLIITIGCIYLMIRYLSQPLALAVSIADRIAEGRKVNESEFNLRFDVGNLIQSLGHMHGNLSKYQREADDYRRNLEEKFEQLAESQASLAEAQQLAKLGNWTWNPVLQKLHWSDETYRILGLTPGACKPEWKNYLKFVDTSEQAAARETIQGLLAAPDYVEGETHITTADGLYRVMHTRSTSVAGPDGDVLRLHGTIQDITERKHAEEKIHYLAMYDSLTGLPNRQLFHLQIEQSVARAQRAGGHMAIMFIDLDRFKRINDTLGHATGDMLLREVAMRLNHCVRSSDSVGRDGASDLPSGQIARLAGDEFTVTLDALAEPQDAARVARRIITEVARPFMFNGQEVIITTSIGIAVFPGDGDAAEMLLQRADVAMYQAKHMGRNSYQFFAGEMNGAAIERLRMEGELRRAVERGQLSLHYQMKIDVRDGSIAGLEALLRWQHPVFGMVPPVTFIPIAEDIGLIVQFGEWVLEEACRQLKQWRDAGLPRVAMAINFASPSFRELNLVEKVAAVINRHGVDPGELCIEATESILMRDADATLVTLTRLGELGVRLSIDDFGTGYSSLSYLRRFPIDQLKIDRSFVNEVAVNSDDAAIVAAIASLARSLNLEVVAEGVETAEQARLLARQGCHIMQGYFFGAPLPAEALTPLLVQGAALNRRMLDLMGESESEGAGQEAG